MGLQVQKVAKRAFPTLVGKDLDGLMKGSFFQALLPKRQRKVGAPKTDESFAELFSRACTMECREQQYIDIADERKGKDKAKKADSEPNRGKGSNSHSKVPIIIVRTLIAIVISRLAVSQQIGRGSSSISSVEHATT